MGDERVTEIYRIFNVLSVFDLYPKLHCLRLSSGWPGRCSTASSFPFLLPSHKHILLSICLNHNFHTLPRWKPEILYLKQRLETTSIFLTWKQETRPGKSRERKETKDGKSCETKYKKSKAGSKKNLVVQKLLKSCIWGILPNPCEKLVLCMTWDFIPFDNQHTMYKSRCLV